MRYHFCIYSEKSKRVDVYLSALFSGISRSYIQKLIDSGSVQINGKTVKKNLKIAPRDEIFIEEIITSSKIIPENIPLDIIYEDTDICVINKDAGINVHPTPGIQGKRGTMVNALLYHSRENLPVISGSERPGIVHRLDKDTSGVIITAKNDTTMKQVSEAMKQRKVEKYYIALVAGLVSEKKFTIQSDIGRDPNSRIRMTSKYPLNPKHAITHGEVLEYIDNAYTCVKIRIETGRTHQIRVHLADIGHPILGDSVYGNDQINTHVREKYSIRRQMLHALELYLSFSHNNYYFYAEPKDDMHLLLSSTFFQKHGNNFERTYNET